jgi:catechol 2,3-dioxygenase-like lactoylglutathione lyase family enzyme
MGEITGIHHLCVQTPDMEASLHFYRDVIGFSVADRETCDFGEYAMLKLGGSRLELIQPNQSDETSFGSQGALAHFGLAVKGIDEVCETLRQKGVRFQTDSPGQYAQPMGGFRAISLTGPSGEAINLYEFPGDI